MGIVLQPRAGWLVPTSVARRRVLPLRNVNYTAPPDGNNAGKVEGQDNGNFWLYGLQRRE
jgi:hypothetical protein